jgi:hypothetical protein
VHISILFFFSSTKNNMDDDYITIQSEKKSQMD